MNISKFPILVSAIFVITVLSHMSYGKTDSSSLEQSLKWISDTYPGHSQVSTSSQNIKSDFHTSITVEDCKFTTTQNRIDYKVSSPQIGLAQETIVAVFNLKDIDPGSLKFYRSNSGSECGSGAGQLVCNDIGLGFETINQTPLIDLSTEVKALNTNRAYSPIKTSSKKMGSYIKLSDEEYAKNFVETFRNAIKLCAARPSSP